MRTFNEIETIMAAWTATHMAAAQNEGWDLFTTTDADSDVQVQRFDDPEELPEGAPHLASDSAAMVIVRTGQMPHHVAAREILRANFPKEWALIEAATA